MLSTLLPLHPGQQHRDQHGTFIRKHGDQQNPKPGIPTISGYDIPQSLLRQCQHGHLAHPGSHDVWVILLMNYLEGPKRPKLWE